MPGSVNAVMSQP